MAAEIKVMSAGAVKSMVVALGAEFERETGNKLNLIFNTAGSLRERIKNGEAADLVILSESAIASLDKPGMFVPGSITDLGRTVTGVVVREGAVIPTFPRRRRSSRRCWERPRSPTPTRRRAARPVPCSPPCWRSLVLPAR